MGKRGDRKTVEVDPKLPVVLQGLMSALPVNKKLAGDRRSFHQAVQGVMHECPDLQGIAKFRGSGFSPEIDACLDSCTDIQFADNMFTVTGTGLKNAFARGAEEHLDPKITALVFHHANALSGRLT